MYIASVIDQTLKTVPAGNHVTDDMLYVIRDHATEEYHCDWFTKTLDSMLVRFIQTFLSRVFEPRSIEVAIA